MSKPTEVHASFGDERAVAFAPTTDLALAALLPWIAMQSNDNMHTCFAIDITVVPSVHVVAVAYAKEWLDMPPDLIPKKEVLQ